MRDRRLVGPVPRRRGGASGKRSDGDRACRQAHRRYHQPRPADRRGRADHGRDRRRKPGRGAAHAGLRRRGLRRGFAAPLPVPGPAARAHAKQHQAQERRHFVDPPAHDRGRVHGVPDPDPDRQLARRGTRLPGAEPPPSGPVLCPAAGAAAVQATSHGRRVRQVLPDRAVLPRRGRARRPFAGRVLPARFRDGLRHPGRRVRGHRAGAGRGVRGIRRGQDSFQAAVPAHRLR